MFTWTETPLSEMWGHLRYLRSPANVERLLTGSIQSGRTITYPSSPETSGRAYEISACIRQADEYYRASDAVGLATQPLLQFYGAESLVKALILANTPGLSLSNIKYHGLAARPSSKTLKSYAGDPSVWKIEDEFGVVGKDGVFHKLCNLVEGCVPPEKTVLTFQQIIRIVPDLANLYRRHYSRTSHCFYLNSGPEIGKNSDSDEFGKLHVYLDDSYDLEDVLGVFPEFRVDYEQVELHEVSRGFRSTQHMKQIPGFFKIVDGTVAGQYLVRPLDCGLYSSICTLFAAVFIVGNVVRYKPSLWMQEIEGVRSGSASFIEALCNLAKRRLPNDVLDGIWGEKFEYGTPGRAV